MKTLAQEIEQNYLNGTVEPYDVAVLLEEGINIGKVTEEEFRTIIRKYKLSTFKARMQGTRMEPVSKEQALTQIKGWFDSGSISKEKYDSLFKGISKVKSNKVKIEN